MKSICNKKILILALLTVFCILILGVNVYAEDTTFSFDNETLDVKLNATSYVSYSGGSGTITWSSSDSSIATVTDGIVTGLKIGTTTITATRGTETASCQVNVVYDYIQIGGNQSSSVSNVNLVLNEHPTETLFATVKDGAYVDVSNAKVTWESSDSSIVSVEKNTGVLQALKAGTVTITATAAGVTDTCEVTVCNAPEFTDFSNATYETDLTYNTETLKISGIIPKSEDSYYYFITPNNNKPTLVFNHGMLDIEATTENIQTLLINTDENYMYTRQLAQYTELNQELYLWVLQEIKLEDWYYDTNDNYIGYSTKFVVEAEKLTRSELPPLNLIIQTFDIGYWSATTTTTETDNYTYMKFNFPAYQENRNFTLKIGKVTDTAILSKIQNNDYSGITDLLSYAKNHDAIYSQKLTTTSEAYYRSDTALFDGNNLLEHNAYYYIYVEFDDENGKYYPIEGVTLGQAWISSISDSWYLWSYTSDDFNWDNLSPTLDSTTSPIQLPNTGEKTIIIISLILVILLIGIVFYKKYSLFRGIK